MRSVLFFLTILVASSQQRSPFRLPGAPNAPFQPRAAASGCPDASAGNPPADPFQPADFVELERTPCFGACPVYTAQIRGDGEVNWRGPSLGPTGATSTVNPVEARALLERLRTNGFWGLCSNYSIGATDGPTVITTLHIGGQEKRVSDYFNSGPELLHDFVIDIDGLADTHRRLHGDPRLETVASYRRPALGAGYSMTSNLRADAEAAKPGLTRLMRASAKGDVDEIRRQLSSGADPNAQDSSGWTALMYATQTDRPEAIKLLLDAGATPNTRSYLGQTALMAAAGAYSAATEKSRLLIAAGGDVNMQDLDGHTALMFAMYGALFLQRAELISLMRAAGARTDLRDAKRFTALDYLEEEARISPQRKVDSDKLRSILTSPQ
jgi:uncharacterized protein